MPGWLSRLGRKRPQSKADLDRLTLRELANAGGDLAKSTETIHYLYLPDESQARAAEMELLPAGYHVKVRPAAQGTEWLALATIDVVPTEDNIARIRNSFETIAERFGGTYDGWEAAVTK